MKNKSPMMQTSLYLVVLVLAFMQGCSSTPIVREYYSDEEAPGAASGLGAFISFNPVGERYEPCSIGDNCWIFGSPYDVYFQIISSEMQLEDVCFEHVEFRVEDKVLYSDDIGSCHSFRPNKNKGDYRAYKRLPMVDLGFHESGEMRVTLKTKFKGRFFEHRLTVRAIKSGESSNDLLRHIYSI